MVLFLLAGQLIATALLKHGYALTVIGDTLQSLLLIVGTGAALANLRAPRGPAREFWFAMSCGIGLWAVVTLLWTWYEVVLKQPVPNPFVGDVFLFLHEAAMIGAFARQPHRAEYWNQTLSAFDLAHLLLWWIYLYAFLAFPWQFLVVDVQLYGTYFNALYVVEHVLLLAVSGVMVLQSSGGWRRIYGGFFAAALLYDATSVAANLAINVGKYYTGSVYDVALALSMAAFAWVSLSAREKKLEAPDPNRYEVTFWPGRMALLALASLPVLLLWTLLHSTAPHRVVMFRLGLTLVMTFAIGALVGVRDEIAHRAVLQLVRGIQADMDKVTSMRDQLLESEKLTSLGRLVAGATHEINNPLTAILGFSEILQDDLGIGEAHRSRVRQIHQHAVRIKETVAALIRARTSTQQASAAAASRTDTPR